MIPDGWKEIKLRDVICQIDGGESLYGSDRPADQDQFGILKTSSVSKGVFLPQENKTIPNEIASNLKIKPSKGCILFNRKNTPELVGTSVYLAECYENLFLPDLLWQLHVNNDGLCDSRWLAYAMANGRMRHDISVRASGSAESMRNINKPSLLGVKFNLPPYKEQKIIAAILSTWDRAIEKTEALIKAKERRKAGLMQRLLTGKVRFGEFVKSQVRRKTKSYDLPEDWGYPTIGDIAVAVSKKNGTKTSLPVLSCTKHSGLVDSLAYFGKQVFSKDLSTYKVVPRGAFAYATNHIEEGSIGYQDLHDKALISPMYTVFKTSGAVHDGFLFKLLKTEWYRHIFQTRTSASVDRRGSLRWKDFAKIHIPLPSMEEQGKIAEVLDKAEQEINEHRNQLAALKEQKKGLMQQLLTGKVRVMQ